jgi:hypothetical protein
MFKKLFFLLSISIFLFLSSCKTGAPDSFMQMNRQYWEVMPIKPSIGFEEAWQKIVYIITKKFELDMISKEDGYVRSAYGPSYFSDDLLNDKYQIRIVVKFSPDKRRLEFKVESRVWDGKIWRNGSDVRVAANMRKDFRNSIGEPLKAGTPADSTQQQTTPEETP